MRWYLTRTLARCTNSHGAVPMFLHSLDGGKTWTFEIEHAMTGAIGVSLSFPSATVGYSVVLNGITQSSSIAKYGG